MARPKTMAKRKIINLPEELITLIDDYRYENRVPTESEAIRQLITMGFKSEDHIELIRDLATFATHLTDKYKADQEDRDRMISIFKRMADDFLSLAQTLMVQSDAMDEEPSDQADVIKERRQRYLRGETKRPKD